VSKHVHQRTGCAGLFIPCAKDQSADTAVDHCAGTHYAGFKRDIQRGFKQTVVLQHQPALSQRHDFSVRGRVVAANWAIPPFPNHLMVMDENRAYGHFTLYPGAFCQR